MPDTAERVEEMENGVLTALGGIMLVTVYLVYIWVRWNFFQADF